MEVIDYAIPSENDLVSNIESNTLLKNAVNFIPGQRLKFSEKINKFVQVFEGDNFDHEIEIRIDAFNKSYMICLKTKAVAYFNNNGSIFQFISFEGNKKSFLYKLYLSLYKVEQGYYKNLIITDNISIDTVFNNGRRILQDLLAPFHIYLNAKYSMEYINIDNEFSPTEISLESNIELISINKVLQKNTYKINIDKNGIKSIVVV